MHMRDNLVVKTHQEAFEPWVHEMTVDLPEQSFLQIQLQGESVKSMDVKIFYSSAVEIQPVDVHEIKTSDAFKELKKVWKLDSNKMYKIVITHSSDMLDKSNYESPCAYFDLIVAINSMESLVDAMQCLNYDDY